VKRIPADEFARHAAEYLEGSEPVSIEKDGEVIGRYVPAPNGHSINGARTTAQSANDNTTELDWSKVDPESRAIIGRLQETLQKIYARTGMTEDEFADLLDPSKPFPYDLDDET